MLAPDISQPRYAFVDADNIAKGLAQLLERRGIPSGEYGCYSLKDLLLSGVHDRILVYSAASPDEKAAPWIEQIQELNKVVVRTGLLTKKGSTHKQQGVDVKLAIDAVLHASRGNMKSCTIYSGDGDFLPLIDALVEMGIFVGVASFANPDLGAVAPALRAQSDFYEHLHGNDLFNRLTGKFFRGGVSTQRVSVRNSFRSYEHSKKDHQLPIKNAVLTERDGLRLWFKGEDCGEDSAIVARFSSLQQLDNWVRFVSPKTNGRLI